MEGGQRGAASIMTGTHKLGWVSHSKRECHHPQKQGLSCDVSLTHSSMERGVIELTGLVTEPRYKARQTQARLEDEGDHT